MNLINKIKKYISDFRSKQSFQDRLKLLSVKAISIFSTQRKCTRCNGEGYIEKWNMYRSHNKKFNSEYNKKSYGVCFICRGGGYEWKIQHIITPNETLENICVQYNLINDRNHSMKTEFVISWNKILRYKDISQCDKLTLWVDFHIMAENRSSFVRIKNGYMQIRNKVSNKWDWFHRNISSKIAGTIQKGYEVHHIDHNKLNNNPLNLVPLPRKIHQLYHKLVNMKLFRKEEIITNLEEKA